MGFRNEVDILSSLDHPHIVKLVEYYESEQNYFLVQDLCAGPNLTDFLVDLSPDAAHLGVSERIASIVIRQILKAVICCHSNGIIHRDIKLDNFIVSGLDQSVQMLDFGLSSRFAASESVTGLVGTCAYMAPEVLMQRHGHGYGTAVDIWSLGMVLYVMLAGNVMFPSTDTFDVGGSYEVRDCNGTWWPMRIVEKSPDDTYTVEVDDKEKTVLSQVKVTSLRHCDVRKRLERELSNPINVRFKLDTLVETKNLSKDAHNILVRMLEHDPKKRITAAEALSHRFVAKRLGEYLGKTMHDTYSCGALLANMRKFAHAPRLKQIALLAMTHLVPSYGSNPELMTLQHLFRKIDVNGEGHTSREEFISFLTSRGTSVPADFDEIWSSCDALSDADSNSEEGLSYVEFLASNFPDSLINEKTCTEAFLLIDRSQNNVICVHDLELLFRSTKLGKSVIYPEIIREAEESIAEAKTAPEGVLNLVDFNYLLRHNVTK